MGKPQPDRKRIQELVKHYQEDDEKFTALISEYLQKQRQAMEKYYEENPSDAPNQVLNHAIIKGIAFNNDEILAVGDFTHLLDLKSEELFLWTYEENVESKLVVKVSEEVKKIDIWKTSASILSTAFTLMSQLEEICKFDFDWIYRFDPSASPDKLHLRDKQFTETAPWISIKYLRDLKHNINLIELLERDEGFFVLAQNLIAAKENHEFCQVCALTPEHARMHHDNEPEIWEKIDMIPKMEVTIVQSTRAVEAILGKPGNRSTSSKLDRIKTRWRSLLDIDPDDNFRLVDKSYIDYYYDLFKIRGGAAHSLGKLPFSVSRQLTIDAQSFAWIILGDYFRKHAITNEGAIESLKANRELFDLIPENFSTNKTTP